MGIAMPHLSEKLKQHPEKFSSECFKVGRLMLIAGLIWAITLGAMGPWAIKILYGAQFMGAVIPLKILAVVAGVVFINYLLTFLMVIINKQRITMVIYTVVFFFSLGIHWALVTSGGLGGAAIALLLSELLVCCLTSIALVRFWPKNAPRLEPGL